MNNYKGIIYALSSSTAFGIMPILARIAYANGSNPTTVLIFRFLISSLILFLYLKFRNIKIKLGNKDEKLTLTLLIGSSLILISTIILAKDKHLSTN